MHDASLDDFADESEGAGQSGDAPPGPTSEAAVAQSDAVTERPEIPPEPSGEGAEPAVSTYEFAPGGAACAACGESVEKRWRDDAGLVCPGCKEW